MENMTNAALLPQNDLDTLFIFGVLIGVAFLFWFSKMHEKHNRKA